MLVVGRNKGGAYIICDLDGAVLDRPIAAFRVVPYLARKRIPMPDNWISITRERILEMQKADDLGDDDSPEAAQARMAPEDPDDTLDLPEE